MEKSYIIEVLRTLRTEEQREFGRWLASPFFNTRQDVIDLYDYLCKGNHLWDAKYLDKGKVFKKMFRGEKYNDAKLRQTVHFLGKQLEGFLAYRQVADEKFAFDLAYLKSLRRRKLSKVFQKKVNALNRAGLENEAQDSKGLRNAFVMYDELYSLMLGLNKAKAQHLQQSVDMFDRQFIADKLKYACLELSHNKVFKTDYQSKFLDSVLASIEADQSLLNYPAISAYYYGYRIQTDPATAAEAYFNLRATLEKDREVFSQEELKDIYSMALNYCVGRMNQGDEVFLRESFILFMDGISQGLLIQNGKLSTIAYLNTVSIGLRLKEYEAVEAFIHEYSKYLSKEDREGTEEYSVAKLYFEQKDYANAMSVLATFETKHILINLNAKSMMLKIFYELEEYDALESFLESFRAYLTRKEIISYHRPIYSNLVKYTRRLLRVNTYDKKQLEKLRQEIETANPLPERPWLLEQLEKL